MRFFIIAFLSLLVLSVFSQSSDLPTNSFEKLYLQSNPTLVYSYDSSTQTHNYSSNWDFDKDGIKDKLYFIGTNAAHLFYFLKVILSKDNKAREFKFIQSDNPILVNYDSLSFEKNLGGFAVTEFNKKLALSIIMRLDDISYSSNKNQLMLRRIKSHTVMISFVGAKAKFHSL